MGSAPRKRATTRNRKSAKYPFTVSLTTCSVTRRSRTAWRQMWKPEKFQVLPAIPLRRLRQSVHENRQLEKSSAEVRWVPGIVPRSVGDAREASAAGMDCV